MPIMYRGNEYNKSSYKFEELHEIIRDRVFDMLRWRDDVIPRPIPFNSEIVLKENVQLDRNFFSIPFLPNSTIYTEHTFMDTAKKLEDHEPTSYFVLTCRFIGLSDGDISLWLDESLDRGHVFLSDSRTVRVSSEPEQRHRFDINRKKVYFFKGLPRYWLTLEGLKGDD